jgi:hypothetical protein
MVMVVVGRRITILNLPAWFHTANNIGTGKMRTKLLKQLIIIPLAKKVNQIKFSD